MPAWRITPEDDGSVLVVTAVREDFKKIPVGDQRTITRDVEGVPAALTIATAELIVQRTADEDEDDLFTKDVTVVDSGVSGTGEITFTLEPDDLALVAPTAAYRVAIMLSDGSGPFTAGYGGLTTLPVPLPDVVAAEFSGVTFERTTLAVEQYDVKNNAGIAYEDGMPTGEWVHYTSASDAIAVVGPGGDVWGITEGTTTITAWALDEDTYRLGVLTYRVSNTFTVIVGPPSTTRNLPLPGDFIPAAKTALGIQNAIAAAAAVATAIDRKRVYLENGTYELESRPLFDGTTRYVDVVGQSITGTILRPTAAHLAAPPYGGGTMFWEFLDADDCSLQEVKLMFNPVALPAAPISPGMVAHHYSRNCRVERVWMESDGNAARCIFNYGNQGGAGENVTGGGFTLRKCFLREPTGIGIDNDLAGPGCLVELTRIEDNSAVGGDACVVYGRSFADVPAPGSLPIPDATPYLRVRRCLFRNQWGTGILSQGGLAPLVTYTLFVNNGLGIGNASIIFADDARGMSLDTCEFRGTPGTSGGGINTTALDKGTFRRVLMRDAGGTGAWLAGKRAHFTEFVILGGGASAVVDEGDDSVVSRFYFQNVHSEQTAPGSPAVQFIGSLRGALEAGAIRDTRAGALLHRSHVLVDVTSVEVDLHLVKAPVAETNFAASLENSAGASTETIAFEGVANAIRP